MLGAAFRLLSSPEGGNEEEGATQTAPDTAMTFEEAVRRGSWAERYHKSPRSQNETRASFLAPVSDAAADDGGIVAPAAAASPLRLNYTLEQSKNWGGFLDVEHVAPGAGYYSLSAASAISLAYRVGGASSSPGRAHVRIILLDSSDCRSGDNCDAYPGRSLENYYSFHYILDSAERRRGRHHCIPRGIRRLVQSVLADGVGGYPGEQGARPFIRQGIQTRTERRFAGRDRIDRLGIHHIR